MKTLLSLCCAVVGIAVFAPAANADTVVVHHHHRHVMTHHYRHHHTTVVHEG